MSNKGMFPARAMGVGVGAIALGVSTAQLPMPYTGAIGTTLVVAGVATAGGAPAYWYYRGRHGVAALVSRAERRAARHEGFVSRWDRRRLSSKRAMRKRWARKMRPSMFTVTGPRFGSGPVDRFLGGALRALRLRLALLQVPVAEYAADLGRDNYGGFWVPLNSVVTRIASARSGKSVAMAGRIIDHRGPAVVTTIRKDLLLLTAQLRAQRGPLFVFNAGNVGGYASNLKWSVLSGCTDMTTAERRARQLIGEAGNDVSDREYWNGQARRVLTPLLYAAARAKLPMRSVLGWVSAGGQKAQQAWVQIQEILQGTPEGPAQIENLGQFFGMVGAGDRTRLSITNSLMPALEWLGNPRLAALGDAQGEDLLNIKRDLLDADATIYLLGAQSKITSPMTGTLVAEIVHQATEIAETLPGGRLDPALLLALDELALTVPGPVPQWVKHLGGSGVCMDLSIQGRASLDSVWGVEGRREILRNSAAVLIGAGCNDPDELRDFEVLGDTRWVPQRDAEGLIIEGSGRIEVPVVSAGKIAQLSIGEVLCFNRGPVTKLNTQNAEDRRDVRRAGTFQPVPTTNFEAAYDDERETDAERETEEVR
jgi:type IV secretion system protein VirD4